MADLKNFNFSAKSKAIGFAFLAKQADLGFAFSANTGDLENSEFLAER